MSSPRHSWVLAGFALLALEGPPACAQDRAPSGPGKRKEFRHATHVPGVWTDWDKANSQFLYDEVERDCIGCHDLNNPTPIRADLCERCHYAGFEAAGARAPAPNDLFLHGDHARGLVCRHCHSPRDAAGAVDRERRDSPDDMAVLRGTGSCLACHGPQSSKLYDRVVAREKNDEVLQVAQGKIGGVVARLNTSSRMGPSSFEGERGFFHRDHLPGWPNAYQKTASAEAATACAACHASVLESVSTCEGIPKGANRGATSLGGNIFTSRACAECHVSPGTAQPGSVARPVTLARKAWTSVTAGTFSHKDHLKNPKAGADASLAAARKEIEGSACIACHPLDSPNMPVSFGLKAAFVSSGSASSYDECVRCHTGKGQRVEDARPGDGIDELTHAQLVKDTKGCATCHQLGFVADMKTMPAKVRARRPRGLEFSIETHAHELIALKGQLKEEKDKAVSASCSRTCHVSDPSEQASRIQKARFKHSTHLPKSAAAKDCEACHSKVGSTKGPGEIGSAAAPLYDEAACKSCHKAPPRPVNAESSGKEIDAPLFAHADHVGKPLPDGKKLACEACHENEVPDGRADVGVRPEALACKPCHSHRDAPQSTGKASGDFVASCVYCHKLGVPGAGDKLPPEERVFVAGFTGRQLHPQPQERACDTCHGTLVAELLGGATSVAVDSPESLFGSGYWRGAGRSEFHKTFRAEEGKLARNGTEFSDGECACCHWAQQGQAEAVNQGRAPFRWPPSVLAGKSLQVRRGLANELLRKRDYPGGPCCKP